MEALIEIYNKKDYFFTSGIVFNGVVLTSYSIQGMKHFSFFVSFNGKTVRAQFIKYFHSQSISDSLEKFRFFSFDREKCMLPLFVLLKLEGIEMNYEDNLAKWLQKLPKCLEKGSQVLCKNYPFGNKLLGNHLNLGIISNILGENDCLILSDLALTPGTEGSPVFSEKGTETPVGIVISVSNWWKNEWLNFTVIANLRVVLKEILNENFELVQDIPQSTTFIDSLNSSFYQIYSGTVWGSSVLISREKSIFLTNSHVVTEDDSYLLLENNERIHVSILYKNDELDIAILKAEELPNINCESVKISKRNQLTKGEVVYAVGFPLFPQASLTITKGNIIDSSDEMIKTSCTVNPGASGGGIVDENGDLLAIIVCNAKISVDGKTVVFPKFNMNLPMSLIMETIEEFVESEDVKILDKLNNVCVNKWKMFTSKL